MFRAKSKISHRLFAALFFVAVIPVCLVGYGTYRTAQNALIDTAYMHIHTIAQDQAVHLDTWFDERLKDLKVLSELPSVQEFSCMTGSMMSGSPSMPSGMLANILALTRAKSPSYESIHILGPTGEILASTKPDSEMLTSMKYMEDLELCKKSCAPILTPVHQHTNQRWYMHIVAPVSGGSDKSNAFVLAILDASATLDPILTNRTGLGHTGEAYIVNEEGKIITESRYLSRSETRGRPLRTAGIDAAIAQRDGTDIYANYMGREVVGSHLWLSKYRWALMAEMEKDEILSPIRYIRTVIVATTGGVALLCILVALVMSRRISKPIIQMAEASQSIAQGNLEQRISYSGSDEIGILSGSFNTMAEKLAIVVDSLRRKESSLRKAYSDLLQTQAQLVQSEKMAAIGELVASVVHEMRNPLCSVKLNYQIIGRTIGKESPLLEHYRIGLDQVSQLERMFSNLLDYSKPISLNITPFHLNELIEQSLQQLDPLIKEMRTRIERKYDNMLPPMMGDGEKIRQVLVNIIRNGIEAAVCEGKVEISAGVGHSEEKPVVMLDIIDNGPGISPQDVKRIFQPFFTTKQKGTGLGLSIVKKIVEAHQYRIDVCSEEGHGTVVSLRMQGR
jgi:signal transduction histidine kinase